jgi:hypothetical protein
MNDTPVVLRFRYPLRLLADYVGHSSLMPGFGDRADIGVDENVVMLESWDEYFTDWAERTVTAAAWQRVE